MTRRTAPGRETPTSKSLCPAWCADQDQQDHWVRSAGLWETVHARRFGPFVVYLPQELHDDGQNWVGRCEVHTDETDVVVYYAAEAVELAAQLRAAAQFATDLDERAAEASR